jgi:glycerate dehydrogenase
MITFRDKLTGGAMKGVFLDLASMGEGLDQTGLQTSIDDYVSYETTSPEEVKERIQGKDIVIVNKVVLGKAAIDSSPSLKLIAVTATGTNNIDLKAAKEAGVRVCNVTEYGRPAIVQHTFSLLLALTNRLLDYSKDVQNGRWCVSPIFCLMDYPIVELEGKTLGLIGYGDLGKGVAKMAEAFGMKVLLAARPGQNMDVVDGYVRVPLNDLLPQVDVLSIHCLLSDETLNLIDKNALSLMKPSAYLLNLARGGIVNEEALAEALKEGRLAGAATDVLSVEPPKDGNVLLDREIPNLIVTPHCAWASREARQRLLDKTSTNIHCFRNEIDQAYIV